MLHCCYVTSSVGLVPEHPDATPDCGSGAELEQVDSECAGFPSCCPDTAVVEAHSALQKSPTPTLNPENPTLKSVDTSECLTHMAINHIGKQSTSV